MPDPMKLSVIVPAFNEEAYLASTLDSIHRAAAHLLGITEVGIETIVVDNGSSDETASVARGRGVKVVSEPLQGISRARNAGARHASGEVLVFVDADVLLPETLLSRIYSAMSDPDCLGGGVDVEYRPRRLAVRMYLRGWRLLGRLMTMVQGAAQFSRRCAFERLGGYDETAWIGEDVDFYWRLGRLARAGGRRVHLIREVRVRPSTRRFDSWPLWRILLWTNPVFIALLRRTRSVWGGWYSQPVR